MFLAYVKAAQTTDSDGTVLKHQSDIHEVEVVKHDSAFETADDVETGFADDDMPLHSVNVAAKTDKHSVSKMSPVVKPGKVASSKARVKCKQNITAPVANGAIENDNGDAVDINVYSQPATSSEMTARLRQREQDTLHSTGASGDHGKQQPVSPTNNHTEPVSDAEFIAVVRRKRRDAGAKQKTRQSDDLCSFWHRRPVRPTYVSPKSNAHHPAGTSSPSQMQPASQKLSNVPGVDLWDSASSAFPALPNLRVRRNSTGDVPAASKSNDDGSDLESVKSVQTSTSRRTAGGRSLVGSSYASVVVGNMSSKEPASTGISQSSTNIMQISPHSDGGLESSTSCRHPSNPSTSKEIAIHVLPVDVACGAGPITDRLDSSDFMVASSLVPDDKSCTDPKVDHNDRPTHSGLSARSRTNRRSVLFFDTRSKTSSNPVPSLDISFGFDDSLASAAVSPGSVLVTDEPQSSSVTSHILQDEQTPSVEFLQQSSVSRPSPSSDTSVVPIQRSSFDLRAAQKYLLSGKFKIFWYL